LNFDLALSARVEQPCKPIRLLASAPSSKTGRSNGMNFILAVIGAERKLMFEIGCFRFCPKKRSSSDSVERSEHKTRVPASLATGFSGLTRLKQ